LSVPVIALRNPSSWAPVGGADDVDVAAGALVEADACQLTAMSQASGLPSTTSSRVIVTGLDSSASSPPSSSVTKSGRPLRNWKVSVCLRSGARR
jgi:hypothetical protein